MPKNLTGVIPTQGEYTQPFRFGDNVQSELEQMELNTLSSYYPPSQSVQSYPSDYDEADQEVANTIRKRRRKKGHGWSRPKGSSSSRSRSRSVFSEASKTTYTSNASALTGYTTDYSDSEGLLLEHGLRVDEEVRNVTTRRRRKRGHNWSRPKGISRASSRGTNFSRASRKTVASSNLRADTRAKKLILETRTKSVRLKNMFNDILAIKGNLREFTTAYLIQEKACYEFYNSDEESQVIPLIKTRYACKMRDEVLHAFKCRVYECSKCGIGSLDSQQITEHMIETHNSITLYICEECGTKFVLWEHYEVHKEKHDRIFKANCLFCSREFTHRKTYEAHMDLYLTCSYKCMYCGNIYLDNYAVRSHVKKRHKGMKFHLKPISCIICRVDYDKPDEHCYNQNAGVFVVRVLIQNSTIERSNCNSPILNIEDR